MNETYQQQAQAEMYDAAAQQDRTPNVYRVREKEMVIADGLPSLGHAQQWRDNWERKHRGRAAIVEQSPPSNPL